MTFSRHRLSNGGLRLVQSLQGRTQNDRRDQELHYCGPRSNPRCLCTFFPFLNCLRYHNSRFSLQLSTAGPLKSQLRSVPHKNKDFSTLPQETIIRFLRARDLNIKDATSMLNNHLEFRKQWMKDDITAEEIMPALQSGCWSVGGLSKSGHPILMVDTRLWNPADYPLEVYVKYLCFFYERIFFNRNC